MATIEELRVTYADLLNKDIALDSRIRCLYVLKEADKSPLGAAILAEAVDTTDSVLLQHELVYNIGQFRFAESIPRLRQIVETESYDVVTRHEALEALGAIAEDSLLPFLYEYAAKDGPVGNCAPLRESAVLAICRIEMKRREGDAAVGNPDNCHFVSVDPSPAFAGTVSLDDLETILRSGVHTAATAMVKDTIPAALANDEDAALIWNRYRAMFTLRNIGGKDAAVILGKALRSDTSSCLFRHEIAFVLGQLEHPASEPYLAEALADEKEHAMVRHEAAEAIGALAEKHSFDFLQKYAGHNEAIVRDSCVVALDMHTYWSQYKKPDESDATPGAAAPAE